MIGLILTEINLNTRNITLALFLLDGFANHGLNTCRPTIPSACFMTLLKMNRCQISHSSIHVQNVR